MSDAPPDQSWHLDRKVPLALIFVLLGQLAMGVWVAAELKSAVANHDRRIVLLETNDSRVAEEARRISETLARLDERIQAQTSILRRVEEGLSRSVPRLP